ncbi:MAG: putative DNA binding domain-containing protein [Ignavibacteriaceae bacterium]|nr:putative DNA binding domain-containing protein [Ignavibacteriaceae bacterium]
MQIKEIIKRPEGRRLEFKQELPGASDLAKTIVAFANDAGGDIYIGIRNTPRELSGIPEADLLRTEEQIASIIHDLCAPLIVPDISIYAEEGKYFIRVQIHRGSDFPYHIKSKGVKDGTYIRIGSTSRLADEEIISELQRRKRNLSFDSESLYDYDPSDFPINSFSQQVKDLTGEELDAVALIKLLLVKEKNGKLLPTNAFVLFSEYQSRKVLFPYAKIECARYKGISTDIKIDEKTIVNQIGEQPAEAFKFVQRHIEQSSVIEGVITKKRWEYPMGAVREVLRNAVVHRDYSLTGKDIKVAIYDDMVEITSPGLLPPSIDFQEMDARQSDIRNRVIAPIFKHLGIIDQWGNGLKIISHELKSYPEIEFRWFEKGLQLQIQFVKKNYKHEVSPELDLLMVAKELSTKLGLSWDQAGTKSGQLIDKIYDKVATGWYQIETLLAFAATPRSIKELMNLLSWKNRTKFRNKFITPLLEVEIFQMTIPEKPNSPKQQYFLTVKGMAFYKLLQAQSDTPE